MAWAFGESWDCYANPADAINGYWDATTTTGNNSLQPGRFAGSQALRWTATSSSTWVKTSAVNDAVHHFVVAFNQSAAITGSSLGLYLLLSDGTTGQCAIVFRSDGAILLTSGTAGGTVLDTYTGAFPVANTWYAFEFEVVINNTAGSWAVRKNGNTTNDRALGSLNTRPVSANNYANKLTIAEQATVNAQHLDDLYWRSDASSVAWMGDIRCYTRAPASDASAQFSRTPTGVLTQTVPPTTNNSASSSGIARYTQFTATYSGTVTNVSVSFTTAGNAVNMKCAIYADNAGAPGAILATATAPFTPVVAGTNTFTFSPGVAIVKGTAYWIGAATDGTTGLFTTFNSAATGASSTTSYAVFPQANPVVSIPSNLAQMSWTYTATPANWQAVSEAQQDATTSYVYDSVVGHSDLYGIAAIASTPLTTYAVTTRAYAIKSDAGTRTMAVQLKSGSTTVASPTVVLTPSNWQWAWRHDTTDPATGAAWTAAAVNVAQVGPVVIA
jgi:hypothetical protein